MCCFAGSDVEPGERVPTLRINELMASNDGVWIDEIGNTDDWIELVNAGAETLNLGDFSISDRPDQPHPLPRLDLEPGEVVLLWADEEPEQGSRHLPFRLTAEGETLYLFDTFGFVIDEVAFEALPENESYARLPDAEGDFARCRYASPEALNGDDCLPPEPPSLPPDVSFSPYEWPEPFPPIEGPLVINEAALRSPGFVEIVNVGDEDVDLTRHDLRLSSQPPGDAWPDAAAGVSLGWGAAEVLAPGERLVVDAPDAAELLDPDTFEGVLTVFDADGDVLDRLDFMRWPEGSSLARVPDSYGIHRFCSPTEGAANDDCQPLASRDVGDRVRHLRTDGDFAALAQGGTGVGIASVKFIVDMDAGDVVHLVGSEDWALHYTFIREQIYGDPRLDRCDPAQAAEFHMGWVEFSQREYFQVEGHRFLLGTLNHHSGSGLLTVDFTTGDSISAEQMRRAFFAVTARVLSPSDWALHPQSDVQVQRMLLLDGELPIVGRNAPFQNQDYQPLTDGVGYGTLRFYPSSELDRAPLGPDVIVVTDDVPNDIQLVGGLVTEAFQTPLAHVNVLSRARDTPNMALRDARHDPDLSSLFDVLVRLEVNAEGFRISRADPEEAAAFWESRRMDGPRVAPRLDLDVRGIRRLDGGDRGLEDMPIFGAKASQLAELHRVQLSGAACAGPLPLPANAAGIPVVHSVEHFEASGAAARLAKLSEDPAFTADPTIRGEGLAEVRSSIMNHPVDPDLLAGVEDYVRENFGAVRVRFRSSSNTEDLTTFNGAGLYTSVSGDLDDPERRIEDAIRTVWASLWNQRAYDEREYALIDHQQVAMGILVHPAFREERANGVAISRNILDPIRSDRHYMNLQAGEASVTNPAPGVVTEQLVFAPNVIPGAPQVVYQSRSSLIDGDVMSLDELGVVSCALRGIHDHFRPLLDPEGENRWFAMEIELKLNGPRREFLIKQARPYSFGSADIPADCREF